MEYGSKWRNLQPLNPKVPVNGSSEGLWKHVENHVFHMRIVLFHREVVERRKSRGEVILE